MPIHDSPASAKFPSVTETSSPILSTGTDRNASSSLPNPGREGASKKLFSPASPKSRGSTLANPHTRPSKRSFHSHAFSEPIDGNATTKGKRAPAPPPIIFPLRASSGYSIQLAGSSLRLDDPQGLNIFVPTVRESRESPKEMPPQLAGIDKAGEQALERGYDEGSNTVSTVLLSPRRSLAVPATSPSPAWQPPEMVSPYPQPTTRSSYSDATTKSPTQLPTPTHSVHSPHPKPPTQLCSPFAQPAPLSPHSKISQLESTASHGLHARNLSLFYPHPQSPAQPGPSEKREALPEDRSGRAEKPPFAGNADWSFAAGRGKSGGVKQNVGGQVGRRRGHHLFGSPTEYRQHKHSLSHNFFSFLDPTVTNPDLANASPGTGTSTNEPRSTSLGPPHIPRADDTPTPVPMPISSVDISISSPTLSPLPKTPDPMSQLLATFALLQFLIGSAIWVEGQMGGWKSLVAVGYLVIFDAMGVGIGIFARGGEGWTTIRRSYGTTRLLSLLYFSQSIYLLYASVCIAKESIEQVVMSTPGGHAHGHSHIRGGGVEGEDRPMPYLLLLSGALATAFGGGVMHTHAKLVDTVGPLFLSSRYLERSIVQRFPHLLANPFSVGILGSCAWVLAAAVVIPFQHLHTFDALASLFLTLLSASLSMPPSIAFGQVLLQTAPPSSHSQTRSLQHAIREIRSDSRVIDLTQTCCWAVAAGSAPPSSSSQSTMPSSPMSSRQHSHSGLGCNAGSISINNNESPHSSSSPMRGHSRTPTSDGPMAWCSPSMSPTVGEFGGIHPSQYPSLSKGSASHKDVPLILTMKVEVSEDVGDWEIIELTKEIYQKLRPVCKGSHASGRFGGMGEVAVAVRRLKAFA